MANSITNYQLASLEKRQDKPSACLKKMVRISIMQSLLDQIHTIVPQVILSILDIFWMKKKIKDSFNGLSINFDGILKKSQPASILQSAKLQSLSTFALVGNYL